MLPDQERVIGHFTVLGSDAAKGTFVATLYDRAPLHKIVPLPSDTTGIADPDLKAPQTLKALVDNAIALSQQAGTDPVIEFIPVNWQRENSMP